MASSFTMAPQAPHAGATKPKRPLGKDPPTAPERGPRKVASAPPRGPHNAHPSHPGHRGGVGGWVSLLVIAAAAAGGLWFWLGGNPAVDTSAELLAQMEAAAQGSAAPTHVFGGALTVSRTNGRASVVAENVPSRACVQVGWRLAREGTIIVNGTLPTRLSAAKLSDLCSGDAATLMWVPGE